MVQQCLVVAAGVLLACVGTSTVARANDTVEPFDQGAWDAELFAGHEGVGRPLHDQCASAQMLLGYGLVDRLSAYVDVTGRLVPAGPEDAMEPHVGIFGTLVDSDHVDLDLGLGGGLQVSGEGTAHTLELAGELNLDHDPNSETFGTYLQPGIAWLNPGGEGSELEIGSGLGAYVTALSVHQFLLESRVRFAPDLQWETVSLGYNVKFTPTVELLTELGLDLSAGARSAAVGASIGFIFTLPATPDPA
jgi:hypothetical protein